LKHPEQAVDVGDELIPIPGIVYDVSADATHLFRSGCAAIRRDASSAAVPQPVDLIVEVASFSIYVSD